jgi:hypothetical protein
MMTTFKGRAEGAEGAEGAQDAVVVVRLDEVIASFVKG